MIYLYIPDKKCEKYCRINHFLKIASDRIGRPEDKTSLIAPLFHCISEIELISMICETVFIYAENMIKCFYTENSFDSSSETAMNVTLLYLM